MGVTSCLGQWCVGVCVGLFQTQQLLVGHLGVFPQAQALTSEISLSQASGMSSAALSEPLWSWAVLRAWQWGVAAPSRSQSLAVI